MRKISGLLFDLYVNPEKKLQFAWTKLQEAVDKGDIREVRKMVFWIIELEKKITIKA